MKKVGAKKRPLEIGQLSIEQALRGFAVKPKLELSAELQQKFQEDR